MPQLKCVVTIYMEILRTYIEAFITVYKITVSCKNILTELFSKQTNKIRSASQMCSISLKLTTTSFNNEC